MNANSDIFIFIVLKLALVIGFIYGLYKWKSKSESKIPIILYWILGFFCVWVVSFTLFEWILKVLFLKDSNQFFTVEYCSSIGSLLGLALYIFIGVKFFRKKEIQKDDSITTSNKTN